MEADKKHKLYSKYTKIAKKIKDFIEGEDAVKEARTEYLPMLPSQAHLLAGGSIGTHKTLYDLFLSKATVFPATSQTAKAQVGMIGRKTPDMETPEGYDDIFCIGGEDIYTAQDWATENLMSSSLCGILVDYPSGSERPYAVKYEIESILDFDYEVRNGGKKLIHVALVENMNDDGIIDEVVHLNLVESEDGEVYTVTYYELQENSDRKMQWVEMGTVVPVANNRNLDYIPFVFASNQGTIASYSTPLLNDVANLNKAHYQNDAEYRNALAFAGRPTPCVAGLLNNKESDVIQLGTSTVLQFEQGGSWGMLGLDSASGIEAIRTAGEDLKRDMAIAGSRAITSEVKGFESAQTAGLHREGEHGQLTTTAKIVSDFMTKVLEIMADWAGIGGEFYYRINADFDLSQVDAQTIQTLFQMYLSGVITFETLWYNMQKGELTPDLVTAEEERAAAKEQHNEKLTGRINLDA